MLPDLLLAQSAIRLLTRDWKEQLRRDLEKAMVFHWRTICGIQAISPANAVLGVYFPTPKKYLIARLWTALMQEKDLKPQTAAP